MGLTEEDDTNELPQRKVTISRPFYLGIHPVTQGPYAKLMGKNPISGPTILSASGRNQFRRRSARPLSHEIEEQVEGKLASGQAALTDHRSVM
jgi:formylglycine-generating enzyme required for sulfatase activity